MHKLNQEAGRHPLGSLSLEMLEISDAMSYLIITISMFSSNLAQEFHSIELLYSDDF